MSTNEQSRYTADEVLETERILRKHSNGPGTFDFEAADMLHAYVQSLTSPAGGVSDAMVQQLRGRAQFLRDKGCIKSPQLMEQAAARLEAALSAPEPAAPCSLDEALAVLQGWADHGGQVHGQAAKRLRALTDLLAPAPSEGGKGVEAALPPAGWLACSKCNRHGRSDDCARCGGSGWRRKCHSMECVEYGCCGGQHCYIPRAEVEAELTRQLDAQQAAQ